MAAADLVQTNGLSDEAGDGVGAVAIRRQQNDPGAPDVLLRAVAIQTIASNRTRSAGVTVIDIPLRIAHARTTARCAASLMGVIR
jgi:hypothetical protein